jgi:SAM-dependent methyltransferase
MRPDGSQDSIEEGSVVCPTGHALPIRKGVLQALTARNEDIGSQLSENARERRGDLTKEEKAAYRQHVSQIGCVTYNELVRANAGAVLDAMSLPPGISLDLGGGSGWLAAELASRGFHAVSLDIEDPWERSAQIAAGAATRDFELVTDITPQVPSDQVDFVVASMDRIPFRDASFTLVTMSAALHHSEDPTGTLKEAARVLQPGGTMLVMNEPVKGLFRDEKPILHGRGEGAGDHLHSIDTYLAAFRAAGFDQPRLHFPGWVDRRLSSHDWDGVIYYKRLLPVVGAIWSLTPVRTLVKGPLLRPLARTFGLTLIAEATKR